MKIGLLGGTFDPIHLGHLIVAEDVRVRLDLDEVIFIPARHPWLKVDREITDGHHRLAMVELATASNQHFRVSVVELERAGPSYTADTVEAMRSELASGDEVFFIAGADALSDLPRWRQPDRLATLCHIVEVARPGTPNIDQVALKSIIPEISGRIRSVDVPQIGISSTQIRDQVSGGLSIRYLVPTEVERYIYEHNLYIR